MKVKRQYLVPILLLAILMAALFVVGPSWLAATITLCDASERACDRARAVFGPVLADLDRDFCEEPAEDEGRLLDADELDDELHYLRRRYGQVLACFVFDGDDVELDDPESVRGAEKIAARARLLGEDNECPELEELMRRCAGSAGVEALVSDGQTYQVAWRRLGSRAAERTGAEICGLVLDDRLVGADAAFLWSSRLAAASVVGFLAFLGATMLALVLSLRKARRDAFQKTTFVSSVSHELRTPLTGLLSYAEMLATGRCRTEEKRAKALAAIIAEGRRLDRMVSELLDFSRLERGTRRYRCERFGLADVARETVDLLRGRFPAFKPVLAVPEDLEVVADRDTVRQILENLLVNAAKYAADGGPVEVSAAACRHGTAVRVADRGPGLTRTQMRRAFRPFWRADDSTTRTTSGYGIGLSVARAHARAMDGDLVVAARAGGGCVFELTIPADKKEAGHG